MSEQLKQTHHDVEIVYHENLNRWIFELNGKEQSVASLREARTMIDKTPKPKRATVRFPAVLVDWSGNKLDDVIVGAFSKDYRGRPQFWISNDGSRSKENVDVLVKPDGANAPLLAEVRELTRQIQELKQQRAEKIAAMERIDVPEDATPTTR